MGLIAVHWRENASQLQAILDEKEERCSSPLAVTLLAHAADSCASARGQ